jgi:transposase
VTVAEVPWARHGARFTRELDDQASWLAVHVSKSTLAELMRTTWRSVGRMIARVTTPKKYRERRSKQPTAALGGHDAPQ